MPFFQVLCYGSLYPGCVTESLLEYASKLLGLQQTVQMARLYYEHNYGENGWHKEDLSEKKRRRLQRKYARYNLLNPGWTLDEFGDKVDKCIRMCMDASPITAGLLDRCDAAYLTYNAALCEWETSNRKKDPTDRDLYNHKVKDDRALKESMDTLFHAFEGLKASLQQKYAEMLVQMAVIFLEQEEKKRESPSQECSMYVPKSPEDAAVYETFKPFLACMLLVPK
jgi:hypothetical protein